jgi:hypothetical protein
MLKIYLASRYSRRPEMEEYARQLQGLGFEIGSGWVWGNHDIVGNPRQAQHFATLDRSDLLRSDLVINFAEPKELDYPRGSRHTEFGMAYERGKVCYVVGSYGTELENIFHSLEGVVIFADWQELYPHLQQLAIFAKAKAIMETVVEAYPPPEGLLVCDGETPSRNIFDPGHGQTVSKAS